MKIPSFRTGLLAVAAGLILLTSTGSALAQINIQFGGNRQPPPPPPPQHDSRWHAPYRGAYWIQGHNEWRNGRWVWVAGYYTYPPRPGAIWVEGSVGHDGRWREGHWR